MAGGRASEGVKGEGVRRREGAGRNAADRVSGGSGPGGHAAVGGGAATARSASRPGKRGGGARYTAAHRRGGATTDEGRRGGRELPGGWSASPRRRGRGADRPTARVTPAARLRVPDFKSGFKTVAAAATVVFQIRGLPPSEARCRRRPRPPQMRHWPSPSRRRDYVGPPASSPGFGAATPAAPRGGSPDRCRFRFLRRPRRRWGKTRTAGDGRRSNGARRPLAVRIGCAMAQPLLHTQPAPPLLLSDFSGGTLGRRWYRPPRRIPA